MGFLGIDLGTSSVKILLLDKEKGIIHTVSKEYPVSYPVAGWAEQNPNDWWQATQAGICELLQADTVQAESIEGIGLSGQMHGLTLLDAEQKVLMPAILWCDQRTHVECGELTQELGEQLARYTGNQALTGFTAPKIMWIKKHHPEIFVKIAHVLLPKDYLRWQLTGVFATDVSDASGTLFFDVAKRQWSQEMLEFLGLSLEVLPDCYESCEITGYLSAQAAAITGLPVGIPVVGGGGDQACGAVGTGVVQTGDISVALGTSGVVFACQDDYIHDPQSRLHAFCHANGKWHVMGVMLAAASCLKWWVQDGCGLRDNDFNLLLEEAAHISPGCDGLVFLPYLMGERNPYNDPHARGAFVGLTMKHSRAHMTRAVLEGVAYGLNDLLEIVKAQGVSLQEVRVSGGGAKSPLWRQILADVLGYPICLVNSVEGPALGAAIMAAVGTGAYTDIDTACRTMIQVVDKTLPQASEHDAYQKVYAIYHRLYGTLRETFIQLS